MVKTIFEKSQDGQKAYSLPKTDPEFSKFQPENELLRKEDLPLPEISELDLMRHFSNLAKLNMGIDTNFYPLGSCTMKYNPRINETAAALPEFTKSHPLAGDDMVQGNLQIIHELTLDLAKILGMETGSLLPNAGAQGEFVCARMIHDYHLKRGDDQRKEILIPDSAHGTNPSTAIMAGFKTVSVKTCQKGYIDLDELKKFVGENTAGLMLTNPNTLGLFLPNVLAITEIIHQAGGLVFLDGANLNPMLGQVRPGDMGFDLMHINLHKTFSTPHGGGGPGSGPIFCNKKLKDFLPLPRVKKENGSYKVIWEDGDSIGKISSFHGNFGVYLRAYLYIKLLGSFGLRKISEAAVVNANYLKKKLDSFFNVPFDKHCMHEFVIQADNYLDKGIKALDIAKRMLDYGVHAPTIYFPLIIKECILIEPTETESKATLDYFIQVMENICKEINTDPDIVKCAPQTTCVSRLDEVKAVRQPVLTAITDQSIAQASACK